MADSRSVSGIMGADTEASAEGSVADCALLRRSTALAALDPRCKPCARPATRTIIGRFGCVVDRIICGFDIADFTSALPLKADSTRTSRNVGFMPNCDIARVQRYRVGGGLAAAALPHHRTYGSVYGGSCLQHQGHAVSFVSFIVPPVGR